MSRDDRDDRSRGRDRDDRDDRRGSSSRDRDDRGREETRSSRDRDDRGSRDRDDDRSSRDRDRGRDDRGGRDDDRSSGSSRGFTYQGRSAEDVRERGEKGAIDYDKLLKPGIKMFKVNDGENRIRLLPATWKGARHYGLDVYVHYGVGPDRASYICPRKHGDAPCSICDERDEARSEDNPDEKYVKDLDAKRRVLVYLVDRNNEKEGEQAWFMPWTLDKDITKISVDKDTGEVLPIDHPEDGYDVTFDRTGKGDRTKYEGVSISRRPSPLGKMAWLDHAMDNPLPDQLNVFPSDHIAKAFGAKGQQRDSRDRNDRDREDRRSSNRDDDRGRDDRDNRSRDRDDRGGRDRDDRGREETRGSSRDDRDDRGGRGRDRDDRGRGGRDSSRDEEPTWDGVHGMTRTELEDLIELRALPIKPREAKDDEDLADWVCEELKLKKVEPESGRRRLDDDPPVRDGNAGRLAEMRRSRGD